MILFSPTITFYLFVVFKLDKIQSSFITDFPHFFLICWMTYSLLNLLEHDSFICPSSLGSLFCCSKDEWFVCWNALYLKRIMGIWVSSFLFSLLSFFFFSFFFFGYICWVFVYVCLSIYLSIIYLCVFLCVCRCMNAHIYADEDALISPMCEVSSIDSKCPQSLY